MLLARDDRLRDQTQHESDDDRPQPAHGCLLVRLDVSITPSVGPFAVRRMSGTAVRATAEDRSPGGRCPGLVGGAGRGVPWELSGPGIPDRGRTGYGAGRVRCGRMVECDAEAACRRQRPGVPDHRGPDGPPGRRARTAAPVRHLDAVRTLSVVLAATLWNVERHVAIVALVLGALLPYVAVVIANAGRENAPSLPSTFVTAPDPADARAAARGGRFRGIRPGRRARPDPHERADHGANRTGWSHDGSHLRAKLKKSSDQSCCSSAGRRVTRDILRTRSASPVGATDRRRAAPPVAARRRLFPTFLRRRIQ